MTFTSALVSTIARQQSTMDRLIGLNKRVADLANSLSFARRHRPVRVTAAQVADVEADLAVATRERDELEASIRQQALKSMELAAR